ncbi:hypothetical protein KCU81_g833, partial [Aureobasidium melanogenum]
MGRHHSLCSGLAPVLFDTIFQLDDSQICDLEWTLSKHQFNCDYRMFNLSSIHQAGIIHSAYYHSASESSWIMELL